ncbi:uncharacterized protein [Anabrus simplex]|uniref:uncharacterized protein n=1 Tax=Anabrus simplex TaxID=316456 RepID=UPI0035A26A5B
MASKFFFVLLALCLAQGLRAKSLAEKRDVIDDIINNALDKARQAIEELNKRVLEILESSKANIEQTVEQFITAATWLLDKAVVALEGLAKRIATEIEDMVKKAEESGKDIAKCVEGKVTEAEAIEEEALTNMKKCFADIEQVQAYIKTTFETGVSEIEAELGTVAKDVLSCLPPQNDTEHNIQEAEEVARCLITEATHLPEEEQALLNKISAEVAAAVQKTGDSLKLEVICLETEQQAANDKEHALIKEVEKCIAEQP